MSEMLSFLAFKRPFFSKRGCGRSLGTEERRLNEQKGKIKWPSPASPAGFLSLKMHDPMPVESRS